MAACSSAAGSHAPGHHELGVGHAGRADGVHPDAERRTLDGDGLGEQVHGRLGGAVDRPTPAHEPGDRPGVEDHAARALGLELQHGMLAAEEHAAEVDGDEPMEVFERVVLELHAEPRRRDAGVVVEHVEAAERLDRGGDHGDDVVLDGHVGGDGDGGAARLR